MKDSFWFPDPKKPEPKLPKNLFGDKKIQIIRYAGDLNSVELTEDDTKVYRSKSINLGPDLGGVVPCAPYDNHFVFYHRYLKDGKPTRGWTLWCSCGSPAAVVGWDAYAKDASAQGAMIVCLYHANYNKHSDGSL